MVTGDIIGPYKIIGMLGEGGMGQVWRATDTTLGRQVAIKILPDAFAADPERLARFEREAKTLASLIWRTCPIARVAWMYISSRFRDRVNHDRCRPTVAPSPSGRAADVSSSSGTARR